MGRKSKAEVRKKEILNNFYSILKEEGFENTSIAKIARRMDVNPSLLIHYFKTKDEMVVAFVENLLHRHEENFKNRVAKVEGPQAKLDEVLDVLFSEEWLNYSDPTVFYACYYLSSRNQRVKQRFKQMYTQFKEVLIPQARAWSSAKIINEQNPEAVADYIIIMNEGLMYYDKLMSDPQGFSRRARYLKDAVMKTLTN
jgi:AcrR family transcriptional regulator